MPFLHRHSGLHIQEVAQQTGPSRSYTSLVLLVSGCPRGRPLKHLADAFGADAVDLRLSSEASQGLARSVWPLLQEAVACLSWVLRRHIWRLVVLRSTKSFSPEWVGCSPMSVEGALTGPLVPCWENTSALITATTFPPY